MTRIKSLAAEANDAFWNHIQRLPASATSNLPLTEIESWEREFCRDYIHAQTQADNQRMAEQFIDATLTLGRLGPLAGNPLDNPAVLR